MMFIKTENTLPEDDPAQFVSLLLIPTGMNDVLKEGELV